MLCSATGGPEQIRCLCVSMRQEQGLATDTYWSSDRSAADTFVSSKPGFGAWQILSNFGSWTVGQDLSYLFPFIGALGSQSKFKFSNQISSFLITRSLAGFALCGSWQGPTIPLTSFVYFWWRSFHPRPPCALKMESSCVSRSFFSPSSPWVLCNRFFLLPLLLGLMAS